MSRKGRADKKEKKHISKSGRVGLQVPVGRLGRYLKHGNYVKRIGFCASIFLSAVLEYLTVEVLELARNATWDNKKTCNVPRYLQLSIRKDGELRKLLADVITAEGGVWPNIHSALLQERVDFKMEEKTVKVKTSRAQKCQQSSSIQRKLSDPLWEKYLHPSLRRWKNPSTVLSPTFSFTLIMTCACHEASTQHNRREYKELLFETRNSDILSVRDNEMPFQRLAGSSSCLDPELEDTYAIWSPLQHLA